MFQVCDILLCFETRALQRRLGSKIQAKFCHFSCKKLGEEWVRYLREFYQFGIGPVYDILLMRHCLAVWEIRGRVSKKKKNFNSTY